MRISKKALTLIGLGIILLVGVGVTVFLVQQQQDIRQKAAAPEVAQACGAEQPADIMLIFDRSGSMNSPTSDSDSTTRMVSAKAASSTFLDKLSQRTASPLNMVSLSTISSDTIVKTEVSLTENLASVKTSLNALTPAGGTCIECGLDAADKDFATKERSGIKNVVVMMTDGGATQFIGGDADTAPANRAEAEKRAQAKALAMKNKYDATFYTIGFGEEAKDSQLLTNIATESGGQYFFAPDAESLKSIYENIASLIGKGSIAGSKFFDRDGDGIIDADETKINNWPIDLYNDTGTTLIESAKTDDNGDYIFDGLCDGSYTIKEGNVEGWVATNESSKTVTVTTAQSVKDVDFGNNQVPPPTACEVTEALCQWDPVLGAASYSVTISEDGTVRAGGPVSVNAPITQYSFPAAPGKSYTCKVEAINSCGTGPSGEATASCPLVIPSPTVPLPSEATPTSSPTPIPPTASPTPIPPTGVPPTGVVQPSNTPVPPVVATYAPGQPTFTPTPTMVDTGSPIQTITIAGGVLLTVLGAILFFAL